MRNPSCNPTIGYHWTESIRRLAVRDGMKGMPAFSWDWGKERRRMRSTSFSSTLGYLDSKSFSAYPSGAWLIMRTGGLAGLKFAGICCSDSSHWCNVQCSSHYQCTILFSKIMNGPRAFFSCLAFLQMQPKLGTMVSTPHASPSLDADPGLAKWSLDMPRPSLDATQTWTLVGAAAYLLPL